MASGHEPATHAPRAPLHRLEYIDGVRALAALWVAAHHAIESSVPETALRVPVLGPVLASLFFGQFPVMVFLMLSGFCLYYPYVKRSPDQPKPFTGWRPYLVRRWVRIATPYLAIGSMCLVMAAIPALQVGRWEITGPVDAGAIASHLLFVHNLFPQYYSKIDYPMWSIGLEWQLYLVFPLLIAAFRRRGGVIVTAALLLVALAIRASYRHLPPLAGSMLHEGPFSYLEIFAAGMVAATLTARRKEVAPSWLLAGIAVAGFAAVRFGSGNGIVHDVATSAAAFCILLLAADPNGRTNRFLSARWLVRIGVFSYSLYLVHAPVLHLLWFALRPLNLSAEATFAVLALVGLPLAVVASYGFHCVFERPFMRPSAPADPVAAAASPADASRATAPAASAVPSAPTDV